MANIQKSRLAKAITVTAMMTSGNTLPPDVVDVYIARLARYTEDAIGDALRRCQNEVKGHLALRDIIERIEDGHPPPDEAWAICPKDESQSVVWTDEIAAAYASTLSMGDSVAARMAFRETYQRLIRESRSEGKPVKFYLSAGRDVAGREAAVSQAVALGRMDEPKEKVKCLPVVEAVPQLESDRPATQEEVKEAMKKIRQTLGMDVFKRDEGGE